MPTPRIVEPLDVVEQVGPAQTHKQRFRIREKLRSGRGKGYAARLAPDQPFELRLYPDLGKPEEFVHHLQSILGVLVGATGTGVLSVARLHERFHPIEQALPATDARADRLKQFFVVALLGCGPVALQSQACETQHVDGVVGAVHPISGLVLRVAGGGCLVIRLLYEVTDGVRIGGPLPKHRALRLDEVFERPHAEYLPSA